MNLRLLIKITLVNLATLAIFIFIVEFAYRLISFAKSCSATCDFARFSIITNSQRYKRFLGISKFSEDLGHEPNSNLDLVINAPGWKDIKVSTDRDGFRNSHPNPIAKFKVLTVGDSFTWGNQVSDDDTWQSCLNKRFQDIEFVNAGVFGYGTHQALMRSQEIIKNNNYEYVILQTLVGRDFKRDQLDIRSGFVKPYLKKHNGNLVISPPPPKRTPNTKYGPLEVSPIDYLLVNLTLLSKIPMVGRLHINSLNKFMGNTSRKGIDIASIEEIIEHTANASSSQRIPYIWLLQYASFLDQTVLNERKSIIRLLTSKNIAFIDTFNALHVSKKYSPDQLWFGHHTPLGNKIVCQEIASYFESPSIER